MLSVNYISIKQGGKDSSAGLSVLRTRQGVLGGGAGGEELWFPFCLQGQCSKGTEEGWRGGAETAGKGRGGAGREEVALWGGFFSPRMGSREESSRWTPCACPPGWVSQPLWFLLPPGGAS